MITRTARARALWPLVAAVALTACESRSHLTLAPAGAATNAPPVPAIAQAGAAGSSLVIPDPAALPASLRAAKDLKLAIGHQLINVSRAANGAYEAQLPPGVRPTLEQDGTMTLLFVLDDATSQLVKLQTGSAISFAAEPVKLSTTDAVPLGMAVGLEAATDATEETYSFAWAAASSLEGPWQPLAVAGKRVNWTPAAPGAYYMRVEAIDKAKRVTYAARTSTRAVQVVEPDARFVLDPAGGSLARGKSVKLSFQLPAGVPADAGLTWYAGPSAQGPWSVISGAGQTRTWLPTAVGAYHLRVDVPGRSGDDIFVSTKPRLQVVEGAPIVTASRNAANRGDRVDLTLNMATEGLVSWFASQPGGAWTAIPGTGTTVKFLPNTPGAYHFRADVSQPDGTVKSLTTTEPILNVAETPDMLTTDPSPALLRPGDSVTIKFKAAGMADETFHYVWYVSPNPATFGWTPLPYDTPGDLRKRSVNWKIPAAQTPGNYFVRVDAVEDATGRVYPFTSSAAQLFITLND